MTYRYTLASFVGLLLLGFAFAPAAEASHFRYGEIRCEPTGNPNEYECYFKLAWRRTFSSAWDQIGDVYNVGYSVSGVGSVTVAHEVIAINTTEDWSVSEGTETITFPGPGTYTIQYGSCCRIGGLGNPGSSFRHIATVEVGSNAMPRSSIPPIVGYTQSTTDGTPALQQLPVFDPDGDPTQCRLAPTSNTGGGSQPAGFSVSSSCQMSWDNANLTAGLYWVQIYVDQLDGQGNIVQTTPYDFIMRLGATGTDSPPTCDIDGVSPFHFHNGETIDVFVGDDLVFDILAEDLDNDDVEVSITTALGIGETYLDGDGNPITQPFGLQPQPFTVRVQKAPLTAADVGTHQLTAAVTAANAASAQPCQLTVRVSEPQAGCPADLRITSYDADPDGSGDGYVTFTNTGAADASLDACTFGILHPIMEEFAYVTPFTQGVTLPAGADYTIGYAGAAPDQTLGGGQLAYDISAATGGLFNWAAYFGAFGKAYAVGDGVPDATDPDDEVIASAGIYQTGSRPPMEVFWPSSGASKAGPADPFAALQQAIAEASAEVPGAFALEAAYPNPFNPATTIAYTLAQPADVRLAIYDALGRQVRTLVASAQEAGAYEVRWDGRDASGQAVASGVYLYKLEAGPHTAARTMLLAK